MDQYKAHDATKSNRKQITVATIQENIIRCPSK
jgi:hypothetical protein